MKREDPAFNQEAAAAAAKAAAWPLSKIERQARDNFAAAAWILERRFPELFSRREVQLTLSNTTNHNALSKGILLKCEFPCSLLGQIGGFACAPSIDAPKRIFGFRSDHHSRHLTFGATEDGRKTDSSRLPHSVNLTPADFWHVRRRRVSIAGERIV